MIVRVKMRPAMSMMREFVSLSPEELQGLLDDPEDWLTSLEDIEEERRLELGKAWHGLHYLLTGTAWDANTVAGQAILGGQQFGEDLGYGPGAYHMPDQVSEIAKELSKVSQASLIARYVPAEMDSVGVYPNKWVRDGDEGRDWLIQSFRHLVTFYASASERGNAVIHYLI